MHLVRNSTNVTCVARSLTMPAICDSICLYIQVHITFKFFSSVLVVSNQYRYHQVYNNYLVIMITVHEGPKLTFLGLCQLATRQKFSVTK